MFSTFIRDACASLLLATAALQAAASMPTGVSVQLASHRSSISASEDFRVTVTIQNGSRVPLRILRWHTPTGEIEESLFEVMRDGQPVEYLGAHYKRQAPVATDFVVVAPGRALVAQSALSSFVLTRT